MRPIASLSFTFCLLCLWLGLAPSFAQTTNQPPVAGNATFTTPEDTAFSGQLTGSDPDGNSVTFSIVSNGQKGTVILTDSATGAFTYTPNLNANGIETFTFRVNDGQANSNVATVTVLISAVDDPPVAAADSYVVNMNTKLTVAAPGLMGNDYDPDGDKIYLSYCSFPKYGSRTIDMYTGSFTYTPAPNFVGQDTFTYSLTDGTLPNSNDVTVTITVLPVEDNYPVAAADRYTTPEDVTLTIPAPGILANDTDADGDPLTVVKDGYPMNGFLTLNADGSFSFKPHANYSGNNAYFYYRAWDGKAYSEMTRFDITVTLVDDTPVAEGEIYAVDRNTPLTVAAPGLLANDTDIDSPATALRVVQTRPLLYGTIVVNNNGSFTSTPALNFTGQDYFSYKVSDGTSLSNEVTAYFQVKWVNAAPVASNGTLTTQEGQPATGTLTASDADGNALTYSLVSQGHLGTAVIDPATGSFTYTPNASSYGTDTFTFKVNDGIVDSNTATITVTITPVNTAPVAADSTLATTEDTTATGLLPVTDADGDPLTFSIVSQGTKGTVSITNTAPGAYSYTPKANANGTDTFTFKANDGLADSNIATMTVTITPVDDIPVAVNDSYTILEDTSLTINAPGLLANDVNPDGDTLTAIKATDPAHGTLTLNPDGSFTYTPAANWSGVDTFSYQASDGVNLSNLATVSVAVTPVGNDAPVAINNGWQMDEDATLNIAAPGLLVNDSDADGDTLTAIKVTDPAHGTVTLNPDGSFTYKPVANYYGPDSFTYKANDGVLDSNIATVTFAIVSVNDPPIANDDFYTTDEDVRIIIATPGVLANDTDIDGGTLVRYTMTFPSHGTLQAFYTDGGFIYKPDAGWSGIDTFTYTCHDSGPNGASAPATVTITVNYVNDPPVAKPAILTVQEDQVFTGSLVASDEEGEPLTYILVTPPITGTVVLDPATGNFTYTPKPNFNDGDTFVYKVTTGTVDSNLARIDINITPVPDAPIAQDDALTLDEDATVEINVLANDSDPDGDALTIVDYTQPAHCSSGFYHMGNGVFQYMPEFNYVGTDSFTYTVSDGNGGTATATATITFRPVNDPPTLNYCEVNTVEDTPVTGALEAWDPDGDALTYRIVIAPGKGTMDLDAATGGFTYTPSVNATGSDSFQAVANDGQLDSNTLFVNVFISRVNDAPVAIDGALTVYEDTATAGQLTASDVDGDGLTYSIVTQGQLGTVEVDPATGSYTYTPNLNVYGDDSFTFKVNDGTVDSNTATVTVTITPVSGDAPVASDGVLTVTEDQPAAGTLIGYDPDGDALTYYLVGQGRLGTVEVDPATGDFTYMPNANANGTDTFTFKVSDGGLDSNTATVTVTINPVNDVPTARNDALTLDEDATVEINVLANDSDIDGDALTIIDYTQPAHCSSAFYYLGNGVFQYLPEFNYVGTDCFTYTVSDGNGGTDTATVTITFRPVNDAPTLNYCEVNTQEDTPVTGALDAWDPDGDALMYRVVTVPGKGTMDLDAATGSFTYTPSANTNGSDSFQAVANDGQLDSNTLFVNVFISRVNDAPIATNGVLETAEDTPAVGKLQASDIDGDTLTYSIVSQGQLGAVVVDPVTGDFTYTPDTNANGADTFTFKVNDGVYDSNTATVTVTINAVNDVPVAVDGTLETAEDAPATGTLQAGDIDDDALTFVLAGQAHNGTVVITNPATGAYRYTPNTGFAGDDAFTFTASDGNATSNTATVSVSIVPVNDPPVAYDGTLTVVRGQMTSGMLTGSDPDGNALTFSLTSNGSKGTATITNPATGAFTYTPNAGALGADTFTFTASDGQATSNTATVTVTINSVPLTAVALIADPLAKAKPRTTITLTAAPTGGTNVEYLFQYGVKKKGKLVWTTIRNYSTSPTCTWQMDTLGTYTLQVLAREVGSTATVSNQLSYTIVRR